LRATAGLFRALGFANETHLVFRRTDMTIVAIANTTESLVAASRPHFQRFDSAAVRRAGTFAAYFDPARLYEVGERYPNLTVGVLTDLRDIPRLDLRRPPVPDFMLFDYSRGFYYKTYALKYLKITDDAWPDAAALYIEQALNGTIKPTYISEEPDDPQDRRAVVRLVGKTYEEFVSDIEHDLVMYYAAFETNSTPPPTKSSATGL
jgi:hypothetical protein